MNKEIQNDWMKELVTVSTMSFADLQILFQQNLNNFSPARKMWIEVYKRALFKNDLTAFRFIQESLLGRPAQRIQFEKASYSYRDLLHKISSAEAKYQTVVGKVVEPKI